MLIKYFFITLTCTLVFAAVSAQQWEALYGGNHRANFSVLSAPEALNTPIWEVDDAAAASVGGGVYAFGNRFVTTRYDFASESAIVELRDLNTGALIGTFSGETQQSKWCAVAFNEDALYVHDYDSDELMALNPDDGELRWAVSSHDYGLIDSPIFTCAGHPVVNTSFEAYITTGALLRCIDRETGSTRWIFEGGASVFPFRTKAAANGMLYLITGTATIEKRLTVLDLETGEVLGESTPLPGSAIQSSALVASPQGRVFCVRDEGLIYAFAIEQGVPALSWAYSPFSAGAFMAPACDRNGHLIIVDGGRVRRLDGATGQQISVSVLTALPASSAVFADADGKVLVSDRSGLVYALSEDLDIILWTATSPGNFYTTAHLGREGTLVLSGSTAQMEAHRYNGQRAPVASLEASRRRIAAGESVDFTDWSSFAAEEWFWEFEGGTPEESVDQHPSGIVYNTPGSYAVRLVASNAHGVSQSERLCYLEVDEPIGVETHVGGGKLRAWPNPARGTFTAELNGASGDQVIELFDLSGRMVAHRQFHGQRVVFEVHDLSPGMYLLRSASGQRVKILVQR